MKTALALLLSLSAVAIAADDKQQPVKDPSIGPKTEEVKKLGNVTWDPEAHKLIWIVQKGSMVNGNFVPNSEQRYEISPDEAVMTTSGEKRGFEEDEATQLNHLLGVLSLYCAESTVWWDQGQGTPVNGEPGKDKPSVPSGEKPVRVAAPENPAPAVAAAVAWAR
jgi:hypothetical protein